MKMSDIAAAAMAEIERRREKRSIDIFIRALGRSITFFSVSGQKRAELFDAARGDARLWAEKVLINSSGELRQIALELCGAGKIGEYEDVCAMFSEGDLCDVLEAVIALSDDCGGVLIGRASDAKAAADSEEP